MFVQSQYTYNVYTELLLHNPVGKTDIIIRVWYLYTTAFVFSLTISSQVIIFWIDLGWYFSSPSLIVVVLLIYRTFGFLCSSVFHFFSPLSPHTSASCLTCVCETSPWFWWSCTKTRKCDSLLPFPSCLHPSFPPFSHEHGSPVYAFWFLLPMFLLYK